MSDLDKLCTLLPHWIEHNAEHAEVFREWAERARAAGGERLAAQIEAAAQEMEGANHHLEHAVEQLGEMGLTPAAAPAHHHQEHAH